MDHPSNRSELTRRSLVGVGLSTVAVASASTAMAQGAPTSSPAKPGAPTTAPTSQTGLSPRLTLHAIDNFHGTPAAGMVCDLAMLDGEGYKPLKIITTTATGRPADPVLVDDAFKAGHYELVMHFEEYFSKLGVKLPSPNFLSLVPIRFQIHDAGQRYHLPVLLTPWGYSYYSGS
ncbi:hydroxyisourate hydrolase [Methylobacterium sp. CM6246]